MKSSPPRMLRTTLALGALATLVLLPQEGQALIFIASGDTAFNTTPPVGPLAGSGWDYQGVWQGLLGTAVAPNFFLTAKHVGGGVGGSFSYQGSSYTTVARVDHPTADLTLWQVSGTLPSYAPLYSGADEAGKDFVLFGRSAVRGAEVTVPGASPDPLRGWLWGNTGGGVTRWGENTVDGTFILDGADYLLAGFSFGGGPNEAMLGSGDSGGGVFIQEGGIWKLAGINSKVQASFSYTGAGPVFNAAIFDGGGLFTATSGGLLLLPDGTVDLEAVFLSTRVSTYTDWIVEKTTAVPEPEVYATVVGLGMVGFGVWRRRRATA